MDVRKFMIGTHCFVVNMLFWKMVLVLSIDEKVCILFSSRWIIVTYNLSRTGKTRKTVSFLCEGASG
jgi:hypothetical protein